MTKINLTKPRRQGNNCNGTFIPRLLLVVLVTCVSSVIVFHSKMTAPLTDDTLRNNKEVTTAMDEDGGYNYELAINQSFNFFNDITASQWELHREIYLQNTNHINPIDPLSGSIRIVNATPDWMSIPATWYQNNYEPNFNCAFEKRIGGYTMNGDGPKWVCDPHRIKRLAIERKAKDPNNPGCVIYSIGSNGDFNFELGMQKEIGVGVCEYHIFDMGDFESTMPAELKRAYYHKWGLKKQEDPVVLPAAAAAAAINDIIGDNNKPEPGQEMYGLQDTIKLLGHEGLDVIDVFKIDCEFCEWTTYTDWLDESIPMLHQILVETHDAPPEYALGFFDTLESAGYVRFHKEANILVAERFRQYQQCFEFGMVKLSTSFMNGKDYTFNKKGYRMVDGEVKEV